MQVGYVTDLQEAGCVTDLQQEGCVTDLQQEGCVTDLQQAYTQSGNIIYFVCFTRQTSVCRWAV